LTQLTLAAKTQLREEVAAALVSRHVMRANSVEVQSVEGVVHDFGDRFTRVSSTLVSGNQPKTELSLTMLMVYLVQPYVADGLFARAVEAHEPRKAMPRAQLLAA
jgi:hypothetical protein